MLRNYILYSVILFLTLFIAHHGLYAALNLSDPNIACGGLKCEIRNVYTCPMLKEYNQDQDLYRNYIINGFIYAKDHRYYAKGGNARLNTFFPTTPGNYAIVYGNKIHDTGLVIDLINDKDDSNVEGIAFHSFVEAGPQLPGAIADDHVLLTTATMSRGFLSFNLFTKYVDGVVKRITGLPKHSDRSEDQGIEFCVPGFGLFTYNHNHDPDIHAQLNAGHWNPESNILGITGIDEVESDAYEFGTFDLQFTGDITIKEFYDDPNLSMKDFLTPGYSFQGNLITDGLYLIAFDSKQFNISDDIKNLSSGAASYDQKFHVPPDYPEYGVTNKKYGLYYKGSSYKGGYPLLSMHPGKKIKSHLAIRKEGENKLTACYCFGGNNSTVLNKRRFIINNDPSLTSYNDCKLMCL